uniref:Carbamate kinase n=1 Tax=Trimastix marina TaxID=137419 RepID=A0A142D9Y6_9EUKA|nr:carbamate kinase [Trimastix marina]
MKVLIALGGNAIKQGHEKGSKEEQMRNVEVTCDHIVRILKNRSDVQILLTHGNGPQSGNLALQQDIAKGSIPPQPLDIVGAMTQGQIGYMFQNCLQNALRRQNISTSVISMINQVLVDANDREFEGENASKPVGNFLTEEEAMAMRQEKGWIVKQVKPGELRGWRRTVPSPDPIRNMEADTIRALSDSGAIVIASGGGGIPVVQTPEGLLQGVEAVIDKDLAGQRLAQAVGADVLMILTDVEGAMINFRTPQQQLLRDITVDQAEQYMRDGQFLAGSMGPKVKACLRHAQQGGTAIITSLDRACEALAGEAGTRITPLN